MHPILSACIYSSVTAQLMLWYKSRAPALACTQIPIAKSPDHCKELSKVASCINKSMGFIVLLFVHPQHAVADLTLTCTRTHSQTFLLLLHCYSYVHCLLPLTTTTAVGTAKSRFLQISAGQ